MKNKLYILVGLPRSGKSTWARTQMKPIVSPDAIRLALHGQQFIGYEIDPEYFELSKKRMEAAFGC